MTVGELLARVSSSELTEWKAYFLHQANPPKPVQSAEQARAVLGSMVKKRKRSG
jgi:hypothetical protein